MRTLALGAVVVVSDGQSATAFVTGLVNQEPGGVMSFAK
jgi:hypothetical protein